MYSELTRTWTDFDCSGCSAEGTLVQQVLRPLFPIPVGGGGGGEGWDGIGGGRGVMPVYFQDLEHVSIDNP